MQWPQDGDAALAGKDHVVIEGELVEIPEDGLRVPHVADEGREPRRAGWQPRELIPVEHDAHCTAPAG